MRKLLIYIIMASLFLTSCSADKNTDKSLEGEDNGKLMVTASFYAMYDFARLIGGDKAEVYNLTEASGEPHEFEPSAADVVKIENSDIFIYSSDNMEGWAEKVIGSVKNDVLVVRAEDGVSINENADPHVWLDPKNAYIQMENICEAFCKKDSANAEYYRANLAGCKSKIDEIDRMYRENIPEGKQIIVSHEAYGYLCNAYGIKQIPLNGMTDETEASPAKIAEIIEFAKNNGIKYVYAENTGSDKTVRTAAEGAGAEVLVLSPFEGETNGRNYFEVMKDNLDALTYTN